MKQINVKEIMKQIRERIKENKINNNNHNDLEEYSNIKQKRIITSHRKIMGPALIKIREFLDDEIQRSIELTINNQEKFNKMILKEVMELKKEIKKLKKWK